MATKVLLVLLTSLLSISRLYAQIQAPAWTGAHVTPGLLFDAAGNTYTYGNFTTTTTVSPGVTLTCSGTANAYVAKFDPSSALVWVRQLTGNVTIDKLKVSDQGEVMLAAEYQYAVQVGSLSASTPAGNPAQHGLLVSRLNAQGAPLVLWPVLYTVQSTVTGFGLFGWMEIMDFDQDAAGNVCLAAWQRGQLLIGSTVVYGSVTTGLNQVIMRLTAQGSLDWVRQGGYLSTVAGYIITTPQLVVAPAGDVYFLWDAPCCPGNFDNLVPPSGGDVSPLIVKYSPQGTPAWIRRFSDNIHTTHFGGILTPAGQFALGVVFRFGFGISFDSFIFNSSGSALVQLNPSSGVVTAASALGSGWGTQMATDASGNFYLGSALDVTCYSPAVSLLWRQYATVSGSGGYPSTTTGGMRLTGSSILISGSVTAVTTNNELHFGATTLTFPIGNSVATNYLAELGGLPLSARAATPAAPLVLFPNPADGAERLTLPTLPVGTQLTVTDALGRVAGRWLATTTLPLTGLAPGFYVVRATAPTGEQWVSRLLVE